MILNAVETTPQDRVQNILNTVNGGKKIGGTLSTPEVEITQNNRNVKDNLGKNDFLQLLVTELKNQDPLEPTKDKEFIAQVAQFSSLEEAQKTNSNMEELMSQLAQTNIVGILGKSVTGVDAESGTTTGKATQIRFLNGEPIITIEGADGSREVKLDGITKIEWTESSAA